MSIIVTPYFGDFIQYYKRAKILQDRNHYDGDQRSCGDPLMDHVSIYDTVLRKHAGFSNVLEDLHGRVRQTNGQKHWSLWEWIYIYGVHRMTGSGASFYPKTAGDKRHGYMNSIVPFLSTCETVGDMIIRIQEWNMPMFTSKGNQPPPFPKPLGNYKTGGKYYLCEVWPDAIDNIVDDLSRKGPKPTIREATGLITDWNVKHGYKRFLFTMTAMTMDIAQYHPSLIDPKSQCNYGANALLALDAMFDPKPSHHRPAWYDERMEYLCNYLEATKAAPWDVGARPMDVEDVLCDAVRYWLRFVPKVGYEHLTKAQRTNLSSISQAKFEKFIQERK